ncbi:hypothetical protein RI129_003079 [Pyrocoelia pectoralis]|uniref:SWIM-type domain-containing protein n=1 Tax=Pyrocoelia pectoralis TaxID=417401 RepID=A0AAN7ZMR4_9COLE
MKAYKSLQAYKYFEAGFVQKVRCKRINDMVVIVGKVKHSQRMSEKSLDTWVIVNEDGSIRTAHCTCMAGSSEICSHVGAILYAAEYAAKTKETVSCTDTKATWPVPAISKVPVGTTC